MGRVNINLDPASKSQFFCSVVEKLAGSGSLAESGKFICDYGFGGYLPNSRLKKGLENGEIISKYS